MRRQRLRELHGYFLSSRKGHYNLLRYVTALLCHSRPHFVQWGPKEKLVNTLTRGLLIISMLGFASLAMADSTFDGKWSAEVVRPAPAGNQTLAITLNTKEGKVTGSMLIQGAGESPIEWGIIKGDLITFKVKMPFNDTTAIFVYLGKLEGDQIAFGRRPEDLTLGRLVEFTAKKTK